MPISAHGYQCHQCPCQGALSEPWLQGGRDYPLRIPRHRGCEPGVHGEEAGLSKAFSLPSGLPVYLHCLTRSHVRSEQQLY